MIKMMLEIDLLTPACDSTSSIGDAGDTHHLFHSLFFRILLSLPKLYLTAYISLFLVSANIYIRLFAN